MRRSSNRAGRDSIAALRWRTAALTGPLSAPQLGWSPDYICSRTDGVRHVVLVQVIAARQEIRRKVPDILRLVGLSTHLHNSPTIVGREKQRVRSRGVRDPPPLRLATSQQAPRPRVIG